LEPIVGIVPLKSIPPTLEPHVEGMLVRFYKCGPILLRCTRSLILEIVKANGKIEPYPQFMIKVGKSRVTINLTKPERGNGQIVVKKSEFLKLLASA